jgi:signal transduction histidine kinase
MSFKYRFILSFVTLEIFFIVLIVSLNFAAINNSSEKLVKQKIESSISFLEEMIKIPISVYDLSTLDNFAKKSIQIQNINSIIILDKKDKVISKKYNFKYLNIDEILAMKESKEFIVDDKTFQIIYKKLYQDEMFLGSLYLIFDNSDNSNFIYETKRNNIFIILTEILISTLLCYIIGLKLTNKLTNLSNIAKKIGNNEEINIPYLHLKDELGALSNSLNQMQMDLKIRNERLIQQKEELEETQKYKDSFFANMSHELRTPLNSINILSSLMMKNKNQRFDEKEVKSLGIINDCGNKLAILISDILDISKIEAKEMILEPFLFNLDNSINKIIDMFLIQIEKKNLIFELKKEKNIGMIFNDEKLIGQIIINLLSNAIKFTHEGKIELFITEKNEFLEITVKDDGIGIPNDKLEHIFDRFKQVDGSTKRKYGGTGLGLAISKELSLLFEGGIKVESELNKGSIFTLSIKKDIKEDDSEYIIPHTKINEQKVLIINNNPLYYFEIIVKLKKRYQTVIQSSSFASLLENLEDNYSKIFIDVNCVNQEELIEILKVKKFNLYIICDNKNQINEYLKSNSVMIFEKPLDKELLISC